MKIEIKNKNIIIKIPVKKLKELFGDFSSEPKTMTDVIETVTPEVVEEIPTPEVPVEITPEVPAETPVETPTETPVQ